MQAGTTTPMSAAAAQADPMILMDWSTPFDDFKVGVLENVVNVMFGGSGQNVSVILFLFKLGRDNWQMTS